MKFGKRLLDQCVPEWSEDYLNYKLLKRQIMRVAAAQKATRRDIPESPPSQSPASASVSPRAAPAAAAAAAVTAGPEDKEDDEDAAALDSPLLSVKEEREAFRRLLNSELDRINRFYLGKEAELAAAFYHQFEPQVKARLAKPETISTGMEEFEPFFEFCQRVDQLRNYTVLNYIGTLKICKKYDKKTDANEKPQITLLLVKQPFYASTKLAILFTEVQCFFAQICFHAQKTTPNARDFSCPICSKLLQDPIVLSCTHRFCRSCLAKLVSTSDGKARHSCPECQKEFDTLDPANYHVDSILANFLMSHFAASIAQQAPMASTSSSSSNIAAPAPTVFDRMLINMSNPASRRTSPQFGPNRDAPVIISSDAFMLDRPKSAAPDARLVHSVADFRRLNTAADLIRSSSYMQLQREPTSNYFLPYEKKQSSLALPISLQRVLLDSQSASRVWRWAILATFAVMVFSLVWAVSYITSTAGLGLRRSAKLDALDFQKLQPPLPVFHDTVFVGHKVNDVDSICSAIAAAHLFNGYAARADAVSKEASFVLDTFGLSAPRLSSDVAFEGKNWCLLDHNQLDKVPDGVMLDKLVCVMDHHQLQGNAIEFAEPNVVEIQPWGSTTTILAFKYFQSNRDIPRPIAGCLLSGILSDTVNLQSSTTTELDRSAVQVLAGMAGIEDLHAYSQDMFRAKSNTEGLNLEDIMTTDYKEYTLGSKKIFFGVSETLNPSQLLQQRDEMLALLPTIRRKKGADLAFFVIVDVRSMTSVILGASSEEELILHEMYDAPTVFPHVYDAGKRVSRKKDFMPGLIRYLRVQQRGDNP